MEVFELSTLRTVISSGVCGLDDEVSVHAGTRAGIDSRHAVGKDVRCLRRLRTATFLPATNH
jgi:hypothetical protein